MKQKVAPLAGSVDRNTYIPKLSPRKNVAPLAGSVDRNLDTYFFFVPNRLSLPSRGAWIEIFSLRRAQAVGPVAPLAGSVDRN